MRLSAALCAALLVAPLTVPRTLSAQVEAGQIVDDSLHTPLHQVLVSLQRLTDGTWRVVDTARTDDRGLFQFGQGAAGVYRIDVLPPGSRQYLGPVDTLAADSVNERTLRVPFFAQEFLAFQVQEPARAIDGTRPPEYPAGLRGQHMEGQVDAQFVVTERGMVDPGTIRILRSTDPEFSESVRRHLHTARYIPALIDGRPVRQVVQQSFVFGMM